MLRFAEVPSDDDEGEGEGGGGRPMTSRSKLNRRDLLLRSTTTQQTALHVHFLKFQ